MPRNYKMVPVELNFGLDGSDPKVSRGLLKVENGVWTREGAISKRREIIGHSSTNQNKFAAEHRGTAITFSPGLNISTELSGSGATTLSEEQIAAGGAHSCSLSSVSATGTAPGFTGDVRLASYSGGKILAAMYMAKSSDLGLSSEYSLNLDIIVAETGQVLASHELEAGYISRVTSFDLVTNAAGNHLFASWSSGTSLKYFYETWTSLRGGTAPTPATYTSITLSSSAGKPVSVCAINSSPNETFCVTTWDSANDVLIVMSPDNNINAGKSTATETATVNAGSTNALCAIELNEGASALVIWSELDGSSNVDLVAREYDTSAVAAAAKKTIQAGSASGEYLNAIGAVRSSDTEAHITWTRYETASGSHRLNSYVSSSVGPAMTYYSPYATPSVSLVAPAARAYSFPFIYDDGVITGTESVHLWCFQDSFWGGSFDFDYASSSPMLINVTGKCKGYCLTGLAYEPNFSSTRAHKLSNTNDSFSLFMGERVESRAVSLQSYERVSSTTVTGHYVTVNMNPSTPPGSSYASGTTLIGGAAPVVYDGSRWLTGPFPLEAPGTPAPKDNGASSSSVSMAGTFQFAAVYELTDAAGNRYQSAPSAPTTYTHTGSYRIDVDVPSFPLSDYNAQISVYMSANNNDILYLVASKTSDSTSAVTTISIDVDPAAIESNEVLYVQRSELENYPPPPHTDSTVFGDRIVIVPSDAENRLYYSKTLGGRAGIAFNPDNRIELPPTGGDIVAVHPWLEKLFVIKRDAVFFVEGEGQSDFSQGASRGYERPVEISPNIGCADRRSVVRTGAGFGFWSGDIIYQITGGLQLEPIGEAVRYYTTTWDVIGSFAMPDEHCSVWVTSGGHALVFDWKYGRWSTWSSYAFDSFVDVATVDGEPWILASRDSGAYRHLYTFRSGGNRGRDTIYDATGASAGSGSSYYYGLTVDTGWTILSEHSRIYGVELHGYKDGGSPADLVIKEAYNYDNAWLATNSFDTSSLTSVSEANQYGMAGSPDTAMTLYRPLTRTVANAYRIEISEDVSTGTPRTDLHLVKLVFMAREIEARQVRGSSRRIG